MSALVKSINGEIQINLQSCHTFAEMKDELDSKLNSMNNFYFGSQVNIDTGNKVLSDKQVSEIRDILRGHNLNLQDSMANGPPAEPRLAENEFTAFGSMPQYMATSLICRHVRSGQKFFGEGNVVILGDVNPGAEIIAGGNILVMGSLRGMVHAGFFGDESAIVAAYRLNPTQLRIASHITRPPDGELIVVESPELARIRSGKVCIEKLKI
ncbi:MAG: septum site-determining protein MinC [Syntrophomonas sp.]